MADNDTRDIDFEDNGNEHDLCSTQFFPLSSSEHQGVFACNVFYQYKIIGKTFLIFME